jgi:hypothetical protein
MSWPISRDIANCILVIETFLDLQPPKTFCKKEEESYLVGISVTVRAPLNTLILALRRIRICMRFMTVWDKICV